MTGKLDGTTAVVTGASSGIGEATARALAAEGATVALFARRRDRLEALAKEIGDAHAYEVDVTDAEAVRSAIDRAADELGGIGVLINNAGYGKWAPAREADLSEWRKMIDINVNGVLSATHAALPHLTAAARGSRGIADVITVSSVAGRKMPAPDSNVYAASKHAVGAFSEGLRQELAEHHVRVGLVEPGLVETELTTSEDDTAPNARTASELGVIQSEDIADAIAYMATRPRRTAINEILVRPTEQVR